jgi:diguanylate cyclase (GGDEF)-like protein/PAS domain S-box-containing protein
MAVTYNLWLVALSYLIAVVASFTALDLGSRVTLTSGRTARVWLIGGAAAMGIGIWSMHFVGMLAFHLGVPLAYDVPITLVSVVPAIATSALALAAIRRGNAGWRAVTFSALLMGGGICAMHYTGMAAIKMQPAFEYDVALVAASALIAVVASYAALHIAFRTRAQVTSNVLWQRIGAALVMGAAVCGMHYTGMAATEFAPDSICISTPLGVDPAWLAGMVGGGSFLVLTMTLVASVLDARMGDQNARMAVQLRSANAELQARAEALAEQMSAEAREGEARVRAVVDSALDCIIAIDAQGRVLDFNPAAERTFGFRRADMIGASLAEKIIPPAYRERHAKGMERYLATGEGPVLGRRIEIVAMRADGSEFPIELAITVTSIGGEPVFTAHLRDLTARRLAEESLRLRGLAIESSVNGVVIVNHRDPECPIEYANPAFRRITGYAVGEILGRNFESLLRTNGDSAAIATVREGLRDRREVRVLLRNYRKDGSLYWNDLFIAPVLDDAGVITHSVMIVHDVSAAVAHHEELHRLANYDALTGLPNRVLFGEQLAQVIADALPERRPFLVLFADVDQFKFINDSLGHTAGDELLRNVATRLKSCLRDGDIIARLGGDEFVVVLNRTEAFEGAIVAIVNRLLKAVAEPMSVAGHELRVTCSIGVSRFPDDGVDASDLLKNADAAMYLAKRNGRNNVQNFTCDLSTMIDERVLLQSSLHGALERGEFLLHYHPQIDLASGKIVGLEALLRWNHPERGLTSPCAFIALAEETGVIVPIGEWVLGTACRQMVAWDRMGLPPLVISVNVSVRQLRHKGLVDLVAATLKETGLPPERLELELTESLLASDADEAIGVLYAFRSLGVRLAIDDFGTGYSSLGYLKRLPISRLKIDQSFVRNIHRDAGNAAIARTIITLGKSLGLEVLAEGVETNAECAWLQAAGCELAQGYLFSRPMTATDVVEWMKKARFADRKRVDAAA